MSLHPNFPTSPYAKSPSYTFNNIFLPYSEEYISTFFKYTEPKTGRKYRLTSMIGPGGVAKGNPTYEIMGVARAWRYSEASMKELIAKGMIVQTSPGTVPQKKQYLDEGSGVSIQSLWDDITGIGASSSQGTNYPTQKPEALLERIVKSSSNEGDLVADFFCGSGTTAAVAEKLGPQMDHHRPRQVRHPHHPQAAHPGAARIKNRKQTVPSF